MGLPVSQCRKREGGVCGGEREKRGGGGGVGRAGEGREEALINRRSLRWQHRRFKIISSKSVRVSVWLYVIFLPGTSS